MKALVLTGVKEFEIQDLPTPEIQPNEVLINTAYAGVCGTDHDLYAGRPGSAAAVPPIVLGHENSGVVAAIGSEVTGVKVGDRVAVDPNIYCGQCEYCLTQRPELCDHLSAVGVTRDGGLAEQFTAPATVVYKLPDSICCWGRRHRTYLLRRARRGPASRLHFTRKRWSSETASWASSSPP